MLGCVCLGGETEGRLTKSVKDLDFRDGESMTEASERGSTRGRAVLPDKAGQGWRQEPNKVAGAIQMSGPQDAERIKKSQGPEDSGVINRESEL